MLQRGGERDTGGYSGPVQDIAGASVARREAARRQAPEVLQPLLGATARELFIFISSPSNIIRSDKTLP